MGREYRPNVRESAVISKLDHAKENQRLNAMNQLRENIDALSDRVAMKLIEERLIETTNLEELERQIHICLQELLAAEEFEVQFQTANLRTLVPRPNFISLYLTAFIVEKLIDHKAVVEMYGTDEDIYRCVDRQVSRQVPV
jgi:hypothetical protein